MTKIYQVIRTHTSPYQSENFKELEKKIIEKIPGHQYRELDQALPDIPIILITNTHTQLTKIPSKMLLNTALIIHPNSGYDHFRDEVHLWKNIPIIVGHQIRAQAVAEYCLACVFQGITLLPQHLTWIPSRTWNRLLVRNLNIRIFGYGHIGKIVAQSLSSLGAKITIIDPYITDCPFEHFKQWNEGDQKSVDIVIAACGLNQSSQHIFNKAFFNSCKSDLLFINGARGKLVDENALKEYLISNTGAFAFLDVFEEEPINESWINFPQVWKTSHIAGVHQNLDKDILNFEEKVLINFQRLDLDKFLNLYKKELLQNKIYQGVII